MAKVYEGRFGIKQNQKGEVVLGKLDSGPYEAGDAEAVLKRVVALAKEHKLTARIFKPDPKGTVPVILADRWGKPYLAVLPAKAGTTANTKPTSWLK